MIVPLYNVLSHAFGTCFRDITSLCKSFLKPWDEAHGPMTEIYKKTVNIYDLILSWRKLSNSQFLKTQFGGLRFSKDTNMIVTLYHPHLSALFIQTFYCKIHLNVYWLKNKMCLESFLTHKLSKISAFMFKFLTSLLFSCFLCVLEIELMDKILNHHNVPLLEFIFIHYSHFAHLHLGCWVNTDQCKKSLTAVS